MRLWLRLMVTVMLVQVCYSLTGLAYDSDGNVVTSQVKYSDNIYASKSFLLALANYWVNDTIDTTNYDPSNANFTCEFSQTGVGVLGTIRMEALNGSTWQTVCSWTSITLPTSDTNYTCNVSAFINPAGNTTLRCRANSLLSVIDTFRFDYLGLKGTRISVDGGHIVVGASSRWEANQTAGSLVTEGGNVTELDVSANASTGRWGGFYGNITTNIILAQGADVQMLYVWPWHAVNGGVICASVNSSLSSFVAFGANGSDIDAAWGFSPASADSGVNTFTGDNCTLKFGSELVDGAAYADTGSSGGFITCALRQKDSPAKTDMLFCVNVTSNGELFNGETGDYELMVPTPYGAEGETYYFYMSIG